MQQHPGLQGEDSGNPTEKGHACISDLYKRYAPALFEYIRRHSAALSDAEDILAEVFMSALRYDLSRMSMDEQRAWLWTVARNKVNDAYRQTRRKPQVSLEVLEDTLEDGTTPEELALQQEEAAYLHGFLRRLSRTQREVLQLRFTGGLRCTEIAVILKKREGAVRSILSRALNELRRYYER